MPSITNDRTSDAYQRLRALLNALSESERESFATRCGTTVGYLRKAISINQDLGPELSLMLETHTQDMVTVAELRPNFAVALERAGYVRASPAIRAYLAKARQHQQQETAAA